MQILLLCIVAIEITAMSCKTRQPENSQVKSEADIDDSGMKWVASEGRWAIRCRDGKLHRGHKSTLVRTEDLKTACEDADPNWQGGGGGNDGGGVVITNPGGPWGGEISLELCANLTPPRQVDPRVRQLDIAIAPDLQEEIRAINPSNLRAQRLCSGVGGQLAQLVANDDTLNLFTGNGNPSQAIILLVGKVGTEVTFTAADPSLTIPWQIDNTVVEKINVAIASTGTNLLCGTSAKFVFDKCWFLGEPGKSCQQVCEGRGKTYSAFTTSIAGTYGGTNENCKAVCDAFGFTNMSESNPTGGYDCYIENSSCRRDNDRDGDSATSANSNFARFCVCQ